MKALSAKEIIKKEYGNSKNFMTSKVIKYGKINRNMAYELSSGIGLSNNTIYGLSIVEINNNGNTKRRTDLSNCFDSEEEAMKYIQQLTEEYKQWQ